MFRDKHFEGKRITWSVLVEYELLGNLDIGDFLRFSQINSYLKRMCFST